jgi:hypothetical protein
MSNLWVLFFLLFLIGTCEAWQEYNELRRQNFGNYATLFLAVCKRFQENLHYPTNPNFAIPEDLAELTIVSLWVNGFLAHFVTNYSVLANFMIDANKVKGSLVKKSKEAYLREKMLQLGMIELVDSVTYGITNVAELSRLLKDPLSTLVFAHPGCDSLDRNTILSIPFYKTAALGSKNNVEYREAHTPAFFVDDSPEKLSSKRQVHAIVGGRTENFMRLLGGLEQRFVDQGSNEPVQEIIKGRNNTYRAVICGFYNPYV